MSDSATTIRGAWAIFERDHPREASFWFARELYLLAACEGANAILKAKDDADRERAMDEIESIIEEFAP